MSVLSHIKPFSPARKDLSHLTIGDAKIEAMVAHIRDAPPPADWAPTGLTRSCYLDAMEKIVREALPWVDDQGAVIDPYYKKEWAQTTSRFVASGAILLSFGRITDQRARVCKSMTTCCEKIASGEARTASPDFWMRELATAFIALESVAEADDLQRWRVTLSSVVPEKTYTQVSPDGTTLAQLNNWAVYSSAGEAIRQAAALAPANEAVWGNAFFEKYMTAQLGHFTAHGLYRDPGDPITYDITTRLQIASALAFGYDGFLRSDLEELLRRGGLTMLLFASPAGFVPYGGRSSQFNFQETILCALCELEANRYKATNPGLAGAFKRQAHLSFSAIRRWMLESVPLRHIKNGFDPALSHGIDAYGKYSVYTMLASSFLGLAALYADDSIPEQPAPAEIGGFVLELAPAFHKVFATCEGTQLEIDTAADFHYDATGLGRFLERNAPLELGLAMPFAAPASKWGQPTIAMSPGCKQPAEPVAIGPAWKAGDRWLSLAGLSEGLTHETRVIRAGRDGVEFEVAYLFRETTVVEHYTLSAGKVSIRSRVMTAGKPADTIRFIIPLLVMDGQTRAVLQGPAGGVVRVSYGDHEYGVQFDKSLSANVAADEYANRNGIYRSLVLEAQGGEIDVTLELKEKAE